MQDDVEVATTKELELRLWARRSIVPCPDLSSDLLVWQQVGCKSCNLHCGRSLLWRRWMCCWSVEGSANELEQLVGAEQHLRSMCGEVRQLMKWSAAECSPHKHAECVHGYQGHVLSTKAIVSAAHGDRGRRQGVGRASRMRCFVHQFSIHFAGRAAAAVDPLATHQPRLLVTVAPRGALTLGAPCGVGCRRTWDVCGRRRSETQQSPNERAEKAHMQQEFTPSGGAVFVGVSVRILFSETPRMPESTA